MTTPLVSSPVQSEATTGTYNDKVVAAHVCGKLRKGNIKIGLGLVARYRDRIDEAIDLYGVTDAAYLAQVVVDDFKSEAHATFGDLPRGTVSNPFASTLGDTLVSVDGLAA